MCPCLERLKVRSGAIVAGKSTWEGHRAELLGHAPFLQGARGVLMDFTVYKRLRCDILSGSGQIEDKVVLLLRSCQDNVGTGVQ